MNRQQLQDICSDLGIKILFKNGCIKEDKGGYYPSYNQIEKENDGWYYSFMNSETRPRPEREEVKQFKDEKEAIKYFFIKLLDEYFLHDISRTPVADVNSVRELEQFFHSIGVPDEYYSCSVIRPQEMYGEIIDDKMRVNYIDKNNQKKFSSPLVDIKKGFTALSRITYRLYLIKELEKQYLKRKMLTESFTDDDILVFLM
ncbi:hypothetical protein LC087_18235 [Bacillus carboniphilus]|uniref:Immunity protein 63 domain-containing protein n=1 Tax=Bacillus carboniphilus TaxID=86663 RepID=A0ABY9JT85_9BACI|nr:hypothetical protein [Bacillus carboniphilus]WLR42594.1 hypothetical protein LC087_18235 [Bacillus carboniphilus]